MSPVRIWAPLPLSSIPLKINALRAISASDFATECTSRVDRNQEYSWVELRHTGFAISLSAKLRWLSARQSFSLRLVRDFLSAKLVHRRLCEAAMLRLVRDFLSAKLNLDWPMRKTGLRLVRDFLSAKLLWRRSRGRYQVAAGPRFPIG